VSGISSTKKTHAGRGLGARSAELAGVSDAQIHRQGHWNTDKLSSCYLTSLPREAMRGLAGFPPTEAGNY
jgi:hypothetical protein